MKLYKLFSVAALSATLAMTTSCADDYAEVNQDPSNVTLTDPKGLMAQAVIAFQPNDYLLWWYNVNYLTRWPQLAAPSAGFTEEYTEQKEEGGMGGQTIGVLKYRNDIANYIANTGKTEYHAYEAACNVLSVYLGIFDTDLYGDRPYTEACHYADKGILTPKYDKVEDLYNLWLTELDQSIEWLKDENNEFVSSEDVVYGGDRAKWCKLANSLKLRIAARLLANDPAKAKSIAEAVAKAPYMDSLDDDMIFCKASKTANGNNDWVYGTGNGLAAPALTENVANYMFACQDPRIRFIYTKNGFNSKVVQGFIDQGRFEDLPTPVKKNVVLDADGNFKEWGGMGEPWVRYSGLPVVFNPKMGAHAEEMAEYYNPGVRYNLTAGDATKSYMHYSYQSEEMKRGRVDFTLPTVGTEVIQDTEDCPLYTMYMTSAEVNLYLAEFKLLGANLPKSAAEYYNAGVALSVQEYDKVAGLNHIPYYDKTYGYDENEKVIALQAGEVDAMLATDAIKLTGNVDADLEKVYLQQLMHFSLLPDDQFVTARRSGYPKVGSALLPMVKFDGVALNAIPRRFEIAKPNPTDIMKDILAASYESQGFKTLGTNNSGVAFNLSGTPLNSERVWQDKNAPQWGSGHKK